MKSPIRAQLVPLFQLIAFIDSQIPVIQLAGKVHKQLSGHLFALAPTFVTQASGAVLANPERFDEDERARAARAADHQAVHNTLRCLELALCALARRCSDLALAEQAAAVRLCKEQLDESQHGGHLANQRAARAAAQRSSLVAAMRILRDQQRKPAKKKR